MDSHDLICEEVNSAAERWNEKESFDEATEGVLEIKVEASFDGTLREIILVTGTGGPHIEIHLYAKKVQGYWSSASHNRTINNDDLLDQLADYYEQQWEDTVLA